VSKFSLLPEQASTVAPQVDLLLYFLLGVSFFFATLIAGMILVFMVRYRRRPGVDHDPNAHGPLWLEAAWTVIPFGITMIMFFWGASLYATIRRPPDDALVVDVVGAVVAARDWSPPVRQTTATGTLTPTAAARSRAIRRTRRDLPTGWRRVRTVDSRQGRRRGGRVHFDYWGAPGEGDAPIAGRHQAV